MRIRTLVSVAAVAGLGLLAATAQAGAKMSGEQIKALVSGNTTFGKHEIKNRDSYAYNREDGTYVGWSSKWGDMKGTWWVDGDRFCRNREGGKGDFCTTVKDNGDGTYNRYRKGKNALRGDIHILTWTKIEPGNPKELK